MRRLTVFLIFVTVMSAGCVSTGRPEMYVVVLNDTSQNADLAIRLDGKYLFRGMVAVAASEPNISVDIRVVTTRGTHRIAVASGAHRKEVVFDATRVVTIEIRLLPDDLQVNVSNRLVIYI